VDTSNDGLPDLRVDSAVDTKGHDKEIDLVDFARSRLLDNRTKLPPEALERALSCQYHRDLFKMKSGVDSAEEEFPMAHLLAHLLDKDPGRQPSLFIRPDTGRLSTARDCDCEDILRRLAEDLPDDDNN
jgi:hypothetical protein